MACSFIRLTIVNMKMKSSLTVLFTIMLAIQVQAQDSSLKSSIERGKSLYTTNCQSCHMQNGKGVPNVFPPLADADYLLENADRAIRQLKNGMNEEIVVNGTTYNGEMTAFPFSNQELADIMNYINKSWGNNGETVTKERVAKALAKN